MKMNLKNTMKQMVGTVKHSVKKVFIAMTGFMYSTTMMSAVAFAAEDDDKKDSGGNIAAITKPLDNLKSIIVAVVGAIGVIILVKNVMEFAQAYQAQDTSGMNSALKGIVAGTMMALISTVLTILGIS